MTRLAPWQCEHSGSLAAVAVLDSAALAAASLACAALRAESAPDDRLLRRQPHRRATAWTDPGRRGLSRR